VLWHMVGVGCVASLWRIVALKFVLELVRSTYLSGFHESKLSFFNFYVVFSTQCSR
jgi:hypothetical protein